MSDDPKTPDDEAAKLAAEAKEEGAPDDVTNSHKERGPGREDGSIDKELLKEAIDAQKARAEEAEKELAENQGEDRERVKSEEDLEAEAQAKASQADANYLGKDAEKGE